MLAKVTAENVGGSFFRHSVYIYAMLQKVCHPTSICNFNNISPTQVIFGTVIVE